MNEVKEEFIEAVKNDEYAEIDLGENVALVTDWEGDGLFFPYLCVPSEDYQGHESFQRLLEENDISELFHWDEIEVYEQNGMTFADFYGVEISY